MTSPRDIIVTIEKKFEDEIAFNGGTLYMDTSFNPEWNVVIYGIVHSIPPNWKHLVEEDFYFDVEVGDKIYFHYNVLLEPQNLLTEGNQDYWLVNLHQAFCVVRGERIIPVGHHILIEKQTEEVTNNFIIIPEIAKEKISTFGTIYASNEPQLPVGATAHFDPIGMFENKIEGKDVFVMYNSNVLWTT